MAFLSAFLQQIFSWAAKVFLGGLFGKSLEQAEAEGQHKIDASVVQAQTANDSADVDVQIVQDQSKVKDHYNVDVPNPADPFNNSDWNGTENKK